MEVVNLLYLYTLAEASRLIREKDPEAFPDQNCLIAGQVAPLNYLLWMVNTVAETTDREKAARLVGWILAHLEIHGLLDKQTSHNLVKKDVGASPSSS